MTNKLRQSLFLVMIMFHDNVSVDCGDLDDSEDNSSILDISMGRIGSVDSCEDDLSNLNVTVDDKGAVVSHEENSLLLDVSADDENSIVSREDDLLILDVTVDGEVNSREENSFTQVSSIQGECLNVVSVKDDDDGKQRKKMSGHLIKGCRTKLKRFKNNMFKNNTSSLTKIKGEC